MIRSMVIAGEFPFPGGNASALRVRNLAKGFMECGVSAHVVSLWPQPAQSERIRERPCNYQGVLYENLNEWRTLDGTGFPLRNKTLCEKLCWLWRSYSKAGVAARRITALAGQGACDLLMIYGRSFCRLRPMIGAAHRSGKPVIWDVVEGCHGFAGLLGAFNPIYWDWKLASLLLPQCVDAATVICRPLMENIRNRGLARTLIVPHIESFAGLPEVKPGNPSREFNLLYVGALLPRDHPEMMVQIMRKLAGQSVPVYFWIAGKYDEVREGKKMHRCIQEDSLLSRRVAFLGMLSNESLIQARRQAHGLILLRRNNPAERESFPTRLVECLKSGKPLFTSDVGDIGIYLRNEVHAILLDPDDPNKAARAMAKVIQSEDGGFQIGLRGQVHAARCFDQVIHAKRIIEFASLLVGSLNPGHGQSGPQS